MTWLDISVPLGLGIVSSLHCVQMCGPIVLAYSLPLHGSGRSLGKAHLAYNAGRIGTYSLLGAVAGLAGGGVALVGHMAGVERWAALIAGASMILAGVLLGGFLPKQKLVQIGGGVPAVFSRTVGRLLKSGGGGSKLLLGAVMGFLPCGLVYAALIKAALTGSALAGAFSMAAFGFGTAGALLGIGAFSSTIALRLGRHSGAIASVCVIGLGAVVLWRGLFAAHPMGSCH